MNKPLNEYPRPQFRRESYHSLNGWWDFEISKKSDIPTSFNNKILVPYSIETPCANLKDEDGNSLEPHILLPDEFLFYHLSLDIPLDFEIKDKTIIHFTAVDQICNVFLNGELVLHHVGGFLPFDVDISSYLQDRKVDIVLRVIDLSDTSYHSRGKQKLKRGGIWYTPQSGIYLPVWMESVSDGYIKEIKMTPDIDEGVLYILVLSDYKESTITFGDKDIKIENNKEYKLKIDNPILWSPENPYLYPIIISNPNDRVESYFAMRKFSTIKDENGHMRLALNNKPYFMKGVLDQGYYQDSSLTPRNDEDYINDIKTMKELGYNTLRKHIKIESLRWYYHCDKIGMIVWQDFINGGEDYSFKTIAFPLIFNKHHSDTNYKKFSRMNEKGRKEAIQEFKDIVHYLYNVPSIGLWTIFNEGWGQFDSKKIYQLMKEIDSTRIYDHASGWHDQGISETKSLHVYFKKVKMPKDKEIKGRSVILSECGGYHLKVEGHTFSDKTFGYKKLKDSVALENEYIKFMNRDILPNIPKGLSAFIYTELSDVEDEHNGWLTYDRKVLKVDKKKIKAVNDLASY
ncbi:MAG: glycoside hydrolase family 2 [Bacilli bacterium]|nr:glycoside hydrolase family 2 [Bacilli bacterium]